MTLLVVVFVAFQMCVLNRKVADCPLLHKLCNISTENVQVSPIHLNFSFISCFKL